MKICPPRRPLAYALSTFLASAMLTACASTPDPAVVCTSEWIAPRADKALDRIERKSARALKNIRKAGAAYVSGDTPGPLTLLSLRRSFDDLEDELRNGPGVRDLRTLARTCDDPELISNKIGELLERQNVPDSVMAFLERTTILDRLIEMAKGDDAPSAPQG